MSNEPIIFYDIPSKARGCAWSPNTWKIRYSLNYKGLAYTTVWIEYPDIEALYKKIGAEPPEVHANGKPYYCLPVIQDPSTGAVVSDSARIAYYLDSTYPDTPQLIPAGTHVLQKVFREASDGTRNLLIPYVLPAVVKILRRPSKEYYARTREARFGKKLEDVVPTGEAHEVAWKAVEEGYGKLDRWLNEGANEGAPFVMGDKVSFADFAIAGDLQWCMRGFGEDSSQWKDMIRWHGGRWAKLIDDLKKYEGPLVTLSE